MSETIETNGAAKSLPPPPGGWVNTDTFPAPAIATEMPHESTPEVPEVAQDESNTNSDTPVPVEDISTVPSSTEPEKSMPKGCENLNDDQLSWFASRGIGPKILDEYGIVSSKRFIKNRGLHGEEVRCIGFQYHHADGTTSVKFRDGVGNYTQSGSARSLWNIERFTGGDLIITEGEIDAMSLAEAGIFAVSAPNGAPSSPAQRHDNGNGNKYNFLWDAKWAIKKASRVILACDSDSPGSFLSDEISRRIGKARCWRMTMPSDCKDANDILVKHGVDELRRVVADSTPWPIGGLRDAQEYRKEAVAIYKDGMSRGIDVPVGNMSKLYRPSPQTLTVVTGIPGSGKSTFLLWLSVELAKTHGWRTAVFAAETSSQIHLLQIASLYVGKPFRGPGKMSESELDHAIDWADKHFVFLDESENSIESIVERAEAAVLRKGVRILSVDPVNFVSTPSYGAEDNGQRGTVYLLTKLKSFAVSHDVAVWLVAHPRKPGFDSAKFVPSGYDVSGSANFFNIADSGLTISRDVQRPGTSTMTCWKARFDWLGGSGSMNMKFNKQDGSFSTLREFGSRASDWDLGLKTNDEVSDE